MSNRVRKNVSPSPARAQGENGGEETVTVVFTYPDGREYARVDFPARVFAAIETARKTLGVSLEKFLQQAIKRKLGKAAGGPGAVQPGPKVHKNFFLINMGRQDQKELRALCARLGWELRLFLANAVRSARRELKQCVAVADRTQLDPNFVWRLTDAWNNKN